MTLENSTKGDLDTARELYESDSEQESIDLIDRILGVNRDMDLTQLSDAIGDRYAEAENAGIRPPMDMEFDSDGVVFREADSLLNYGVAAIYDALFLRAKCWSAIISVRTKRSDDDLAPAIANSLVVSKGFPNDADMLSVLAQPLLFSPNFVGNGVDMLISALKLEADHGIASILMTNFVPNVLAQLPPDDPATQKWQDWMDSNGHS